MTETQTTIAPVWTSCPSYRWWHRGSKVTAFVSFLLSVGVSICSILGIFGWQGWVLCFALLVIAFLGGTYGDGGK